MLNRFLCWLWEKDDLSANIRGEVGLWVMKHRLLQALVCLPLLAILKNGDSQSLSESYSSIFH